MTSTSAQIAISDMAIHYTQGKKADPATLSMLDDLSDPVFINIDNAYPKRFTKLRNDSRMYDPKMYSPHFALPTYIVFAVEIFGNKGGFRKILELMEVKSSSAFFESIFEFLGSFYPYLHRQFAINFCKKLEAWFDKFFIKKAIMWDKNHLAIIDKYFNLQGRNNASDLFRLKHTVAKARLGVELLSLNNLNKQLIGVDLISKALKVNFGDENDEMIRGIGFKDIIFLLNQKAKFHIDYQIEIYELCKIQLENPAFFDEQIRRIGGIPNYKTMLTILEEHNLPE
jgi:hypothetical protein